MLSLFSGLVSCSHCVPPHSAAKLEVPQELHALFLSRRCRRAVVLFKMADMFRLGARARACLGFTKFGLLLVFVCDSLSSGCCLCLCVFHRVRAAICLCLCVFH